MTISKTTVYKTRDGESFDTLLDAEIHELSLDLGAAAIKQGVSLSPEIKQLCRKIAKNYGEFEEILRQIKLKNMKRKRTN